MTPAIRNHGETRLKPAILHHENLPQTRSLVPRGATTFHTSRMVTGLVTVNGNRRADNDEHTKRRTRLNPTVLMETTPRQTQTKSSTLYNNPRETAQKQSDATNPSPRSSTTAFSPKLSARAVAALGGPLKAFPEDLRAPSSPITESGGERNSSKPRTMDLSMTQELSEANCLD